MFSSIKNLIVLAVTLFAMIAISSAAHAQSTWHVAQDGSGDFTSIQAAINSPSVMAGDTLLVAEGTYLFNWSTKGTVKGTYQISIDLGDGVSRTVNIGLK